MRAAFRRCVCECVEFDVRGGGKPYRTMDICRVEVNLNGAHLHSASRHRRPASFARRPCWCLIVALLPLRRVMMFATLSRRYQTAATALRVAELARYARGSAVGKACERGKSGVEPRFNKSARGGMEIKNLASGRRLRGSWQGQGMWGRCAEGVSGSKVW